MALRSESYVSLYNGLNLMYRCITVLILQYILWSYGLHSMYRGITVSVICIVALRLVGLWCVNHLIIICDIEPIMISCGVKALTLELYCGVILVLTLQC